MAEVHTRAINAGQGVGDQIKRQASAAVRELTIDAETMADQVKDTATQAASAAESVVDQGLDRAAEAAKGAADLARQAADTFAQGADSLRKTDVAGLRDDLTALLRRYPAQVLAVGLVLAVAIWWARRR